MKEIKLSQRGKYAGMYVTLVDDEDFEFLNQFNWYVHKQKHTVYARTHIKTDKSDRTVYMHQLLMPTPAGMTTDHIDRKGLNNQKSNLRICTRAENLANMVKRSNSASLYKGVGITKSGYFHAVICCKYKSYYLGTHKTEIEAAKAYDLKAKELFGEFANLNFK